MKKVIYRTGEEIGEGLLSESFSAPLTAALIKDERHVAHKAFLAISHSNGLYVSGKVGMHSHCSN